MSLSIPRADLKQRPVCMCEDVKIVASVVEPIGGQHLCIVVPTGHMLAVMNVPNS